MIQPAATTQVNGNAEPPHRTTWLVDFWFTSRRSTAGLVFLAVGLAAESQQQDKRYGAGWVGGCFFGPAPRGANVVYLKLQSSSIQIESQAYCLKKSQDSQTSCMLASRSIRTGHPPNANRKLNSPPNTANHHELASN